MPTASTRRCRRRWRFPDHDQGVAGGLRLEGCGDALAKLDEETAELREAIATSAGHDRTAEEIGDLLFVAVNVARLSGVDPESALKAANRKFRRRFRYIEEKLRRRAGSRPIRTSRRWTASGTPQARGARRGQLKVTV